MRANLAGGKAVIGSKLLEFYGEIPARPTVQGSDDSDQGSERTVTPSDP
jgi:hypothetical protein